MPVLPAATRAAGRAVEDPVPALGPGDEQALAKPDAKAFKDFIARYVDRIEEWHAANSAPPAALLPWLKAHPELRHELWLAIDKRDDAKAALAIIEALRAKDEKALLAHQHLAIAIAVVHDQPQHTHHSRMRYLWGVDDAQFGPTLTWQEIWDFYTDPKRQGLFIFKPRELAWPLMVHLVDLDVSREEIDWATREFARSKLNIDLPAFYRMVPYDDDKLERKPPKLGKRPYTLENLKRYGGVCVDQGHFASRVAKIFGVPSMKCAGQGRYGGAGHSWSGYLAVDPKTRFPQLSFTGRYQYDNYYTGDAYDPQTGTRTMDRAIELFYAGVSGRYESYIAASALTRAAMQVRAGKPVLAATLLAEAVRTNAHVDDAWRTLLALGADKTISAKDSDQHWQVMTRTLAVRHPDLVAECLPTYLAAVGDEAVDRRNRVYLDAFQAFGLAKRPDLQIQSRLAHLDELAKRGKAKEVIQLAFEAVGPNIQEGTLVMPLVEQVVKLSKEFTANDKTFKLQVVKDSLAKYANDFPKKRGDKVSPAWVEFEKLMKSL